MGDFGAASLINRIISLVWSAFVRLNKVANSVPVPEDLPSGRAQTLLAFFHGSTIQETSCA